ncbi:hypothetical protein Rhopal_000459-T1 [Rhodotorula paludigena]|uniref:Protein kinase domain-containing protein n=1 Tax=Rhodotorula paludigena TaxID=86838 RepID=A0AAV5GD01_9BASI|nr:hypothetical protein Rhopal_000459-T1 [Rhodotorula paludigena]
MSSSKVIAQRAPPRQPRVYAREPVKYSVERKRNAAGVEHEVLTLEDTPEPAAAAAAQAAQAPANGHAPATSGSRLNDPYNGYEPAPKKRKSDVGGSASGYGANAAPATAGGSGGAANHRLPPQYGMPAPAYGAGGTNAYQQPRGYAGYQPIAAGSGHKRKHDEYERENRDAQRQRDKGPRYCDDDGHFIVQVGGTVRDSSQGHEYVIEKQLGQGTFGKVVAARQKQDGRRYAVKIIRAVHKYQEAAKTEVRVLTLLTAQDPQNTKKCIPMRSSFDFHGHTCLVTPLLSASVFDFLKENGYEAFPLSHVQSFGRQLLTSLKYVHDHKLIHTDLKPENILLEDTASTIVPTRRNRNRKVLKNTGIQLIDFGSATFDNDYHAHVVSTRHYRAPEIILCMGWSYPCDMWSIGCILVEFVTGEALFQTHDNLEHLAMMERVFGPMTPEYAAQGHAKIAGNHPDWFRRVAASSSGRSRSRKMQYELNFPTETTQKQSIKFVKGMKKLRDIIAPTDIAGQRFYELCEGLLRWDPVKRLNVDQALKHPFFSDVIHDEGNPQ